MSSAWFVDAGVPLAPGSSLEQVRHGGQYEIVSPLDGPAGVTGPCRLFVFQDAQTTPTSGPKTQQLLVSRLSPQWYSRLFTGASWSTWQIMTPDREKLTTDRDYYVSTSGNDSNDGLTLATAWRTLRKAWRHICTNINIAGRLIRINLSPGVYDGISTWGDVLSSDDENYTHSYSPVGGGTISIIGDIANRNNYTIQYADSANYSVLDFGVGFTTWLEVKGVTLSGANPSSQYGANNLLLDHVRITGLTGSQQGCVAALGARLVFSGGTVVENNTGVVLMRASQGGHVFASGTWTFVGTNTFTQVVWVDRISESSISWGTPTGTVTGKQYHVEGNSIHKRTGTQPGSVTGTTATGGQVT